MEFYNDLGPLHTFSATAALVLGTALMFTQKGSNIHIKIGRGYVLCMLITLSTAFMIYDLFGSWGIFHWAAVIGCFSLTVGYLSVRLKKPQKKWYKNHHQYMKWSYVGLLAAAFSELSVRVPLIYPEIENWIPLSFFWVATTSASFIVCLIGAYFIYGKRYNKEL